MWLLNRHNILSIELKFFSQHDPRAILTFKNILSGDYLVYVSNEDYRHLENGQLQLLEEFWTLSLTKKKKRRRKNIGIDVCICDNLLRLKKKKK